MKKNNISYILFSILFILYLILLIVDIYYQINSKYILGSRTVVWGSLLYVLFDVNKVLRSRWIYVSMICIFVLTLMNAFDLLKNCF